MPLDDIEVEAFAIEINPFRDDPNMVNMEGYKDKIYQFVFSKQVPGGLYSIHTLVPGAQGTRIEEELKFSPMSDAS